MDNLNEIRQDQILLKCEICDKEFKSRSGLNYHFKVTHNLEKEHQCNICQKVFHITLYLRSRLPDKIYVKQTVA